MRRFLINLRHYVVRMVKDPKELAILLAIPIGLIVINSLIVGDFDAIAAVAFGGYDILASFMAPAFLLSFQFFNSFFMFSFLYKD